MNAGFWFLDWVLYPPPPSPSFAKLHWNCEKEKSYILCCAHGKFCKLCGWFDNHWRVSLVVTSIRSPPGSFPFCLRGLGIRKFYPGSSLTLWPSWVLEGSWREQCIDGFQFIVYRLQYSHGLRVAVCFNLEPRTGYPYLPLEEINISVLVIH
jgi:hypothetical protein